MALAEQIPIDLAERPRLNTASHTPDVDHIVLTDLALERPDLVKQSQDLVLFEEKEYSPFIVRRYGKESNSKPSTTCIDWSDGPKIQTDKVLADIKEARSGAINYPSFWFSFASIGWWSIYPGIESGIPPDKLNSYLLAGAFAVGTTLGGARSVRKYRKQAKDLQQLLDVNNQVVNSTSSPDGLDAGKAVQKSGLLDKEPQTLLKLRDKYSQIDKDSLSRAIRGEAMAFSDKTEKHESIVLDTPFQLFGIDIPADVALQLVSNLPLGTYGTETSEKDPSRFDVTTSSGKLVSGSLDTVKDPAAFIAENFDILWDISIYEGAIAAIVHNQRELRHKNNTNGEQQAVLKEMYDKLAQARVYALLRIGCKVYEDVCLQLKALLDDYTIIADDSVANEWKSSKDVPMPQRLAAILPNFDNVNIPDYMIYKGYPLPPILKRIAWRFTTSGDTLQAESVQTNTASSILSL